MPSKITSKSTAKKASEADDKTKAAKKPAAPKAGKPEKAEEPKADKPARAPFKEGNVKSLLPKITARTAPVKKEEPAAEAEPTPAPEPAKAKAATVSLIDDKPKKVRKAATEAEKKSLFTPISKVLEAEQSERLRTEGLAKALESLDARSRRIVESRWLQEKGGLTLHDLAAEFKRQLPNGIVIAECSILTRIGIRVPDVVWASADFMQAFGEITPYMRAPEICVEVLSESNTEAEMMHKRALFCAAGAVEYWLCNREGQMRFFTAQIELSKSGFSPGFPAVLQARMR